MHEIVATEKDYLKSLVVVIEVCGLISFFEGLFVTSPVSFGVQGYKRKMELLDNIPREKITELFSNIEEIHEFHIGFHKKLEVCPISSFHSF